MCHSTLNVRLYIQCALAPGRDPLLYHPRSAATGARRADSQVCDTSKRANEFAQEIEKFCKGNKGCQESADTGKHKGPLHQFFDMKDDDPGPDCVACRGFDYEKKDPDYCKPAAEGEASPCLCVDPSGPTPRGAPRTGRSRPPPRPPTRSRPARS